MVKIMPARREIAYDILNGEENMVAVWKICRP